MNISIFDDTCCVLGEGPLWAQERLFWVDIKDRKIYSRGLGETKSIHWDFTDRPSALGTCRDSATELLVAFDKYLAFCDTESGIIRHKIDFNDRPKNRSNDGAVGPDGAFWFGTMDDDEEQQTGELFRYDGKILQSKAKNIGISNTVVWSPNGERMYFADSMEQCIWKYEFDVSTGTISNREVFVSLKGTNIYPDGSAIDTEGFLWNAQWDGSRVVRYAPTGKVDRVITLPVSKPTCCTFGGNKLQSLFVTTASINTSNPLAGQTFVIEGIGQGIPENQYGDLK